MNLIRYIGRVTLNYLSYCGRMALFFFKILFFSIQCCKRFNLVIREVYFFGVSSIFIIGLSGLFIGFVLAIQGVSTLSQFNAEENLGFVVAASILREIGPVLAALLFASSAGTAMTSEIGFMRASNQLEAMDIMSINPIARIIVPRFWAGIISMPLLTCLCNAMAILGAYTIGVYFYGLDAGIFWSQMQLGIDIQYDVINGLVKTFVFAIFVTLISVFHGYYCKSTSEGILKATTKTVVLSSMVILFIDFVLTSFMFAS